VFGCLPKFALNGSSETGRSTTRFLKANNSGRRKIPSCARAEDCMVTRAYRASACLRICQRKLCHGALGPARCRCSRVSQLILKCYKSLKRKVCGSRTYKPNSVRLAAGRSFLWAVHYCAALATYPEVVTRRAGTCPADSISLPLNRKTHRIGGAPSLFGLAPCGVCPARNITAAAVRSYRTFSPLPRRRSGSSTGKRRSARTSQSTHVGYPSKAHNDDGAVCFLWHCPSTELEPGLPDVIRHTALRSSDFPPPLRRATVRPGCQPPSLYAMVPEFPLFRAG